MNRVIAFTGAAGAGKTTIASAVASGGKWHYEPAPTRAFYEKEGITEAVLRTRPIEDQIAFQGRLVEFAMAWWAEIGNKGLVVTDRTPIDYLAYWMALNKTANEQEIYERMRKVSAAVSGESLIIFCPWPVPWKVANDGFRAQNAGQNWMITALIEKIISTRALPTMLLPPHTVFERLKLMKPILDRLSVEKPAV